MEIGDLCKVTSFKTHATCHHNDLVLVSKKLGSVYVEGINLKSLSFHHYLIQELEVISESNSKNN